MALSWHFLLDSKNVDLPGITALSSSPKPNTQLVDQEIFAGTKRGSILRLVVDRKGNADVKEELNDQDSGLPYPVYSIAIDATGCLLFCGKGDRFVSTWMRSSDTKEWKSRERLGPHTGWVKDVVYMADHVHSIGCNCIESWKLSSSSPGNNKWTHWNKSCIENCPEMGATLSSDLLCLSPYDQGAFFVGGVDGRIHLWDHSQSMKEPIDTISAHDGRINALLYLQERGVLLSASHDGTIKCWNARSLLSGPLVATTLCIPDERVTSLSAVQGTNTFVFGTHKGQVGVVSIEQENNDLSLVLESALVVDGQPVINALCAVPAEGSFRYALVIGHSLGMTISTLEPN
jgi:WD40 repeat protein